MESGVECLSRMKLAATPQEFLLVGLQSVRARHPRMTVSAVCRKAGISSTGYFSDVLKGKRKIHPKHVSGIQKALDLSPSLATLFALLVEREQIKKQDDRRLAEIERNLESQRKLVHLSADMDSAPLAADLHFHMLVYSSFALFGGRPSLQQLLELFGAGQHRRLQDSLARLSEMQLIELVDGSASEPNTEPTTDCSYRHIEHAVLFGHGQNRFSHVQFLTDSVYAAARSVRHRYPLSEESLFASSIITVSRSRFRRVMADVRRKVLEIQADLDDEGRGDPDALIRFNIQIYPEEFQ